MATTPTTPVVGNQRPVPSPMKVPNPISGQQYCVVCGEGSHRKDWVKKQDTFVCCDHHSDEQFSQAVQQAQAGQGTAANASPMGVPPVKVVPRTAPVASMPASTIPGTTVPAATPTTPPPSTEPQARTQAATEKAAGEQVSAQVSGQVTTEPTKT